MSEFREFVAGLLVLLIVGGIIAVPMYFVKKARCDQQAVSFEDSEYGFIAGCMVKHKGRWIPIDNIRGFDDKG